MNKSKFLKKSLAMVLAVMLVIAMIPLGASAAPAAVWVNDGTIVKITPTNAVLATENKVDFTAEVPYNQTADEVLNVELADAKYDEIVYTVDSGDPTTESTPTQIKFAPDAKKVTFYADNSGDPEVKSGEYTITVNQPAASRSFAIAKATLGDKDGTALVEGTVDNDAKTISFVLPWGYAISGKTGDVNYTLENPVDPANPVVTAAEKVTTIGEDVKVSITNQAGNKTAYTVKTEKAECLTALTLGGVEATVLEDADAAIAGSAAGDLKVELPVGTNVPTDTQTLVLSVAKKYTATWETAAVKSGEKVTVKAGAASAYTKHVLEISDATTPSQKVSYNVWVKVAKSNDASLLSATVSTTLTTPALSFEETAEPKGDVLSVVMPKGTDLTTLNVTFKLADGATLVLTQSTGATVSPDSNGVYKNVNLTNPAQIKVTAADGVTAKYYQLSATAADEANNSPAVTSGKMTWGSGDDAVEVSAAISDKTITFTVPYATTPAIVNGTDPSTPATYVWAKTSATSLGGGIAFGTDPFTDKNTLVAVSDNGTKTTYTVVFTKDKPLTGKELTNFDFSTAAKAEDVSADNTIAGTIASGKISYTLPYSVYAKTVSANYVGLYEISEGAQLWYTADNGTSFQQYTIKSGFDPDSGAAYQTIPSANLVDGNTGAKEGYTTFVVMDEYAAYEAGQTVPDFSDMTADPYKGHVTTYTVVVEQAPAETGFEFKDLTDEEGNVVSKISADAIELTVPYSYVGKAFFAKYEASPMASVVTDSTGTVALPLFSSIADPTVDYDVKGMIKVVADSDPGTYKMQICTANGTATAGTHDGTWADFTTITVTSEAGDDNNNYTVSVAVNEAETGAQVTSLTVNSTNATINHTDKEINVNLPIGSDLQKVTVDFEVSKLATSTNTLVQNIYDAVNDIQYYDVTEPASITVTAEDGNTVNVYTLTVTADTTFTDVHEDDWFFEEVMKAARAGIVSGYPDGSFKPNNVISRQDFVVMLVGMLGVEDEVKALPETVPFEDCDGSYAFAKQAIAYCADKGYVHGDGTGAFRPTQNITRQEVASILKDALDLKGTTTEKFNDDASIADWAKTSVYACKDAGIFKGDEGTGNFRPDDFIKRLESAIVMNACLEIE